MKRLASILILAISICSTATTAAAQNRDRQQYRDNIREYKHNFLKQSLDLSSEQAESFFKVYDSMDDALTTLNDEARIVETKINEAPEGTITDIEYETATRTLLEAKEKEVAIEKEYYEKFQKILNKKQLFELRKVERDFTIKLLRHYRHHTKGNKK